MAIETIRLGNVPNDGLGDSARDGGAKINRNFADLDARVLALSGLNLVAGPVTKLAPGANPTASLTGTAPNYTLNLGLPEGAAGAGAPNSADILAIPEMGRLERAIATAGVPDEPSLILDFVRSVFFASRTAVAASILTLITALGGVSTFTRASTATFVGSNGLIQTAANNVPRIEYDPVTRLPRGLLIENLARTNFATYSEQISNGAGWVSSELTPTADAAVAPDGLTTGDLLVETTANSAHQLSRSFTIFTSGTAYSASIFVKAGAGTRNLRIGFGASAFSATSRQALFNPSTGAIVSADAGVTAAVTNFGNGWYRCSITATATATATDALFLNIYNGSTASYTGDGASGLYLWGGQLEAGGVSSYIPTGASTVTRAADVMALAPGLWANAVEMSLLVEYTARDLSGSTVALAEFGDGTYDNRILAFLSASASRGSVTSAGVSSALMTGGTYTAGTVGRFAMAAKQDDFAASFAGAAAVTDTSGPMPAVVPTALYIGRQGGGGGGFMGHIRRLIVYPQRLTNAKLQVLSNPAAWS